MHVYEIFVFTVYKLFCINLFYLYSIGQLVWYWYGLLHTTTAAIVVLYTSLVPCMCNIVYDSVEGLLTVNFQCKYSGLS